MGAKKFSVLMTQITPNLDLLEKTQCFPRYIFQENMGKVEKLDNISSGLIEKFKSYYSDESINADKIFFYIYGLLHSKCYREKYRNDLSKELPRIPVVNDFNKFLEIGEKLSDLHVNYESAPKHKGLNVQIQRSLLKDNEVFKVAKMEHPRQGKEKDKSQIIYNEFITVSGIPQKAYEYEVNGYSAIKWIMERYQVKQCKKSKIVNDPNKKDDPQYILNLLQRIVHISVESVNLINALPKITQWGHFEEAQSYSKQRELKKEARKVGKEIESSENINIKSNKKKQKKRA